MTDHDLASDELYAKICTLVHKCLNQEADPAEIDELERLVCEDAQARKTYVTLMHETRSLRRWATANTTPLNGATPPGNESSGKETAPQPHERARQLKKMAATFRGLAREFVVQPAALAILLLVMIAGGVLIWNLWDLSPQPIVQQRTPVESPSARVPPVEERAAPPPVAPREQPVIATLARTSHAVWQKSDAPADGTMLTSQQKLVLKQGLAEIVFKSGATVLLEGPAEFEVGSQKAEGRGEKSGIRGQGSEERSDNSCTLTLGKLVAHVPQQARGFAIETPSMKIVDLGTQFGVNVRLPEKSEIKNLKSEIPTTQVHVFQGLVEIEPRWAQAPAQPVVPIKLQAGEGVASQQGQPPRKIAGDATGFVRELPSAEPATPVKLLPLATWPKDSPLKPGDIVAVANATNRFHLFKIDPRTGEQKLLATGFPHRQVPNDHGLKWTSVAVEPDGNVLVGAQGLGAWDAGLLRIVPRSGEIKVLTRGGLLKAGSITGLAVAADGTIYATYDGAGHAVPDFVLQIDPATGKVTPLARFGMDATGVCLDVEGRDLLVISSKHATVGLVPLTSEPKLTHWTLDPRLGQFDCMAVNREGRVLVGAVREKPGEGTAQILEVGHTAAQQPAKTGQQLVKTLAVLPKTVGTWSPMSMACEADGNLIVGSGGALRQVYRVDPTTGNVAVLSTEGMIENVSFLAVVPGKAAVAGGESK